MKTLLLITMLAFSGATFADDGFPADVFSTINSGPFAYNGPDVAQTSNFPAAVFSTINGGPFAYNGPDVAQTSNFPEALFIAAQEG